jgi:hypothetical protein
VLKVHRVLEDRLDQLERWVQQDRLELLVEQDQLVQQAELLDQDLEDHKDQLELRVRPDHKVFQLHVHLAMEDHKVMVNK